MTRILAERDPVVRVKLALAATGLPDGELTTIVTDALASCPDGRRHALAEWLFGAASGGEGGALSRLSVVAADAVAETVREVLCVQEIHEQVQPNGPRHRTWKHLQQRLGSMEPEAAERQGNLLAALFAAGRLQAVADVDVVLERYQSTRQELLGSMPSGVKAEVAA
jgi:hypothetical protein